MNREYSKFVDSAAKASLGLAEVEEALVAGLDVGNQKLGELLDDAGLEDALSLMIEACRKMSSMQAYFVGIFSDLYMQSMNRGVINHLQYAIGAPKPAGGVATCLRTATRLAAEATTTWPDDEHIMPKHTTLAAM